MDSRTGPITGLHLSEGTAPSPIVVKLTRKPFMSWITITLKDGATEDLEPDDVRAWFKTRGARMDIVEKAMDHVWNFYVAEVTINSPKEPPRSLSKVVPRV